MAKRDEPESEGATPDKPKIKKVRIAEEADAGAWREEGAHGRSLPIGSSRTHGVGG
jgi:hypothetical protein